MQRPPKSLWLGAALLAVAALCGLWLAGSHLGHRQPLALSLFLPHAGGCGWYRRDVGTQEDQLLARFSADCPSVQAAWSPSGLTAAVWFNPAGYPSPEDMLFLVDLKTHKLRRLPLPEQGETQRYAFDATDRLVAYTEDQQVTPQLSSAEAELASSEGMDDEPAGADDEDTEWAAPSPPPLADQAVAPVNQRWLEFAGRRFPSSSFPGGTDVLVHALVWSGDRWDMLETAASRCCAEGAPDVEVLALAKALKVRGLSTAAQLSSATPGAAVRDEALTAKLTGLEVPGQTSGGWRLLHRSEWQLDLVFRVTSSETPHALGAPLLMDASGNLRPIDEGQGGDSAYAPSDVLQIMTLGPYALICDWGSGMDPRLYDMRTGERLFQSAPAVATTFWPSRLKAAAAKD